MQEQEKSRRSYDNRLRRERAEATRERIVTAAADLVGESGSLDIGFAEVAARAAVSQPTVFRYFPSKEHLFAALASRAFRQVAGDLSPTSPGELADALPVVFTRSARVEPLVRWLLASPLGASTPRPHRGERLDMIRVALGLDPADDRPEAIFAERLALLLSSPLAWLYWHDYLGLSVNEAAETAGWAIRQLGTPG
jgi:AcrR family transcriptional regulator